MARRILMGAAFAFLLACAATGLLAQAATVKGIRYPETVEGAGEPLKLIGAGLREKWFFDFYTMGAYSQSGVCEAAAVISADEIKSLRLHMLRDVSANRIAGALREAIADNTPRDASPDLRGRIGSFLSSFQVDLAKRARMELTYVPGVGVLLNLNGQPQGPPTAGKDFADILWSAYFGSKSCCSGLKKQILSSCLKRTAKD